MGKNRAVWHFLATILVTALAISSTFLLPLSIMAQAPVPTSTPVLGGWGGTRLMDTAQNLTGPSSLVFPGENASNFEQVARTEAEVQFGYNAIRVSFAPYCSVQYGLNTATSPQDFMGNYSQAQLIRAVKIAEYFSLWILIDYHGSADFANTTLTDCWLNFWFGPNTVSGPTGVVGAFMHEYTRIIWEPLNEPDSSTFAVSATGWCKNNPLQCELNKTSYAAAQYQSWLDLARRMHDTHWVVVQNLCSWGCSLDRSHWYLEYPNVNDTQRRVFESLHTYLYYPAYVEHVAYDSNSDGKYDSGDIAIIGIISDNKTLVNDPKIRFVNATSVPTETWNKSESIVYDADTNNKYDAADIPVYGTVPPVGTPLMTDPKIKIVDTDSNGVWDGWSNATADAAAKNDYLTMLAETAGLGWPVLNTEGGPYCSSSCPSIVSGAAGYSLVSLRYIQDIINYEDNNSPRFGRLLWVAAPWTTTPNAGVYGALKSGQWGTLITYKNFAVIPIVHNIAIEGFQVNDRIITQGTKVQVNVTIQNTGDVLETFVVKIYSNATIMSSQTGKSSPAGPPQILSFTWDTTGIKPGDYVLKAVSSPVSGEMGFLNDSQTLTVSVVSPASLGSFYLYLYFGIMAVGGLVAAIAVAVRRSSSHGRGTGSTSN